MRNNMWPMHGGQPDQIRGLLNMGEGYPLLDFSANLNPLGPPITLMQQQPISFEELTAYPDPEYLGARRALAESMGLDVEEVLLTNGGAEAIYLTAKLFERQVALIVHPTFSEYEQACQHYHVTTKAVNVTKQGQLPVEQIIEQLESQNIRVLYLCRPNNPTGILYPREQIKALLEKAKGLNITCVIDEAFVDFVAHTEHLTEWIHTYPLILLRSMTKMYTLPGLRIGYVVAASATIERLRSFQLPWSVNQLAAEVVPLLLADDQFVQETRQWLQEEWDFLQQMLSGLGYTFLPTATNFYLLFDRVEEELQERNIDVARTDRWFRFLANQGILARHTYNFKGLAGSALRFAIRSREENRQLIQVLTRWREES